MLSVTQGPVLLVSLVTWALLPWSLKPLALVLIIGQQAGLALQHRASGSLVQGNRIFSVLNCVSATFNPALTTAGF